MADGSGSKGHTWAFGGGAPGLEGPVHLTSSPWCCSFSMIAFSLSRPTFQGLVEVSSGKDTAWLMCCLLGAA